MKAVTTLLHVLLLSLGSRLPAQAYAIDDIGLLGATGSESSQASSINNAGAVVGHASTLQGGSPAVFPVYWSGGTLAKLGTWSGFAYAINQSALSGGTASFPFVARFWSDPSHSGTTVSIGSISDSIRDINYYGEMVGYTQTGTTLPITADGFFRSAGGTVTTFSGLGGGFTAAYGVNDLQILCGKSTNSSGQYHGFIKTSLGSITDVGTIGGSTSSMVRINNLGYAVGSSGDGSGLFFPVYYSVSGASLTTMPILSSTDEGNALDVNELQSAVGHCIDSGGLTYACIWPSVTGGTVLDLNSLIPTGTGWVLQSATGINDLGEITGVGTLNGVQHGFRLRPTSIPVYSGIQPIIPSATGTLSTYGFTSGATVYFVYGTTTGSTAISGCTTTIGIASPTLLGTATADSTGRAHLTATMPSGSSGVTVYSQAFTATPSCEISPLITQVSL